jgi:hypothetical protein
LDDHVQQNQSFLGFAPAVPASESEPFLSEPQLNVPAGTQLQYKKDGVRMQDDDLGDQWTLAQLRNDVHPGFGV